MNIVQKYNGRSLDSIEKIQAVARHIAETKNKCEGLVVVASAMGETTNKLLGMAKKVGAEIPKRELDVLLATGEQQTVALLAIALQNLGIEAQSMTGFQSGFVTNKYHTNAKIKEINTEKVEEIVNSGKVAVVAGFQGIDEEGDITTLGRGGSDITAVGIAAHLGWDCEMYTTSECMYTVDPELYPEAKPIRAITYEEMMEIANLGADKIETRAVELAKKYNVKLFLGKSLETDKSKGTYIMSKEMIINENLLVEDMPITGMSIQDEVSIFTLRNVPADGKAVAECFRTLGELEINVDMISQQMAADGKCTVSFSCSKEQGDALQAELDGQEVFSDIIVDREGDLAMISLVGVGMATHSGVASKVFQVMAENDIRYYHITTSEISISVTVEMDQKLKAAIALCRAFRL
ncbi:MAG: aspartate kinase [Firmicutes bacterium]|nr:aspartate kinase [Bacillota bacterium]